MMLRGFRHPERRASGVMAWEGDYSGLYDAFCKENGKILNAIGRPPWDQEFIHQRLWTLYEQQPHIVQRVINVASYKNHCLGKQPDNAPPESTSIVCFHGNPRPVEVDDQCVRENWR